MGVGDRRAALPLNGMDAPTYTDIDVPKWRCY